MRHDKCTGHHKWSDLAVYFEVRSIVTHTLIWQMTRTWWELWNSPLWAWAYWFLVRASLTYYSLLDLKRAFSAETLSSNFSVALMPEDCESGSSQYNQVGATTGVMILSTVLSPWSSELHADRWFTMKAHISSWSGYKIVIQLGRAGHSSHHVDRQRYNYCRSGGTISLHLIFVSNFYEIYINDKFNSTPVCF